MSFSIGIVGLPNVGKSTLFKALTKNPIDIANYPFCTIEPNKGIVEVPDFRLDKLAKLSSSAKIIPTVIDFMDIAGLVKGAHKGEGLGNKFLANIREVDAICHVVRNFHSGDIIHVDGKVNPDSDIEVINIELAFADLEMVNRHIDKLKSKLKGSTGKEEKDSRKILKLLESKIKPELEEGNQVRKLELEEEERESLSYLQFLTDKPMIYVLNLDEETVNEAFDIPELKDETVVKVCAKLEADLIELSDDEVKEFLNESGIKVTGLEQIILTSYQTLNLISFLTTGPEETRAWTIEVETKAPQAAGKIHGDFEQGFIAVDIINWEKLLEAGSEVFARDKGWIRTEGKNYTMQDGDVCHFKFNR
jgi:ribosome-binding ATPase